MFTFDENDRLRETNMTLKYTLCDKRYPLEDNSFFCPECRKRLKHLLYGEPEKDYKQLEDIIG